MRPRSSLPKVEQDNAAPTLFEVDSQAASPAILAFVAWASALHRDDQSRLRTRCDHGIGSPARCGYLIDEVYFVTVNPAAFWSSTQR